MKIETFIFYVGFCIIFFSCDNFFNDKTYQKSKTPVESIYDPRLNGYFSYYSSWETGYKEYLFEKKFISESYSFDNSDKVIYRKKSGFVSGYDTTEYNFTYEFEFKSGKCRSKLYKNPYDTWGNWVDFYFSVDGKHLYIDIKWFDKSNL